MGLEDSDPVTAENEGLDSGLGDIPPTSDKKTSYCTDNLEPETANVGKNATSTRVAKNKRSSVNPVKSSVCSKSNQGEPGQQHVKESSRKKRKKDLEPDKILDQKKKKSLEKVAEWLLKVPSEDELELERPLLDSDESDSSTSTLDVEPQDTELNPKREDRTKALEEQVFGASGEISPKPNERTEEVEAQIETYPSSEDQDTSVRSSRRSRRLQLFVEEIQGRHKKTAKKSSATKKENNGEKQTEVANGETVDASLPESRNRTKGAKRNGCVYEDDIGGIESTEKSGKTFLRQAEAEVPKSRSPAKAVADPPASVVPNSTSSTDLLVVGPTLESEKPENDCQPGSQQEICVNEANRAVKEYEDCKNDSEVDTEQLLRSFKAAKRKSFHFGEPKVKKSRGQDVDAENCPSRSSFGSGLSPNKVSKRERESPLPVVPQVVDSGLRFTAVEHEVSKGSQITDGQCDCNLKEIRDGFLRDPSLNEGETIFIGESSLTPDALETTANELIHKANGNSSGSEEISNQSSIKINPRKKRRTQRLESSAESDSSRSEEELPTLAQIFGTSDHPEAGIKDQGEISQTNGCEGVGGETNTGEPISRPPASPSPDQVDSSQASVDLFGTPDECK
ncbi:hypothetical protein GOODEAATRI_000937 [Goodea atripinnis]|uniref:Uncharacterized protein n=1 Tax=Goodea atripinnis TaxID=208336 RepID=A0ABV0MGU3_9TELE